MTGKRHKEPFKHTQGKKLSSHATVSHDVSELRVYRWQKHGRVSEPVVTTAGEERGTQGQITESAETEKPPCMIEVTMEDTLYICPNFNTKSEL